MGAGRARSAADTRRCPVSQRRPRTPRRLPRRRRVRRTDRRHPSLRSARSTGGSHSAFRAPASRRFERRSRLRRRSADGTRRRRATPQVRPASRERSDCGGRPRVPGRRRSGASRRDLPPIAEARGDFTKRARDVVEVWDRRNGPWRRSIEPREVVVTGHREARYRFVEVEEFRCAPNADIAPAAQEAGDAGPFGHVLATVPRVERVTAFRRDVVPNGDGSLACKAHKPLPGWFADA